MMVLERLSYWLKGVATDFWLRHIAPWVSCIAVLSGAFLTYDFRNLAKQHSDWSGFFHVLSDGFLFWTFLVTAILTALSSWGMSVRQKSYNSLKTELAVTKEAVQKMGDSTTFVFEGLLLNLSRKLSFPQNDQTRLSLYIHYPEHDYFVPCGRYSPNPKFRKPGRTSYPDNEGCIAKGWQNGWHFDNNFPETKKQKDYRAYCSKQYNIPDDVYNRIRMKSRVYAVKRLDDNLGNQLGLLVIEALEHDRFEEQTLLQNLNGVADDFAGLIRTLRNYIPNPNDATVRGL
jgi:hypothetical protein